MIDIRPRVLYICHNHPEVVPGGAETYALKLYKAMGRSGRFEPILLARTGPPLSRTDQSHDGMPISAVTRDSHQYFIHTDLSEFDAFYITSKRKTLYTRFVADFLAAWQPAIVHIQHTWLVGVDLIRQIATSLPNTPVAYTLHEYLPICHRTGQMLRTMNDEPCLASSPRRCHECFPDISPQAFFMRKQFLLSHLSLIDRFIAPSRFLIERYVDWGIPHEKLQLEENGTELADRVHDAPEPRPRTRFGFFGQFGHHKGMKVLLKAMQILREENQRLDHPLTERPHLWLYGANLELQSEVFRRELTGMIHQMQEDVTMVGRYDHAELPRLMANVDWVIVPSIWWENSPLVIQEAFLHGRPVICSDIGGMAEKVRNRINGLHFRAGDPWDLAAKLREAADSEGLWEELRKGIPDVHGMDDHVRWLSDLYDSLIERRRGMPVNDAGPSAAPSSSQPVEPAEA